MAGVTHHTQTSAANDPAYDVSHDAWEEDHDVGDLSVAGQMALTGIILPAPLGGDVVDYNPAGLSAASVICISSDGVYQSLCGLAGGASGRVILLLNAGSFMIYLYCEHTGSAAANRFSGPSGSPYQLEPGTGLLVAYDGSAARWRMLGWPSSVYGLDPSLVGTASVSLWAPRINIGSPNDIGGSMVVDANWSASWQALAHNVSRPSADSVVLPNCSATVDGLPFVVPAGAVLDIQAGAFFGINR